MLKSAQVFMGRAWRNLNRRISRQYLKRHEATSAADLHRLGSDYGGWYAPKRMPPGAICYCAGVGVDATFDFAIREAGADVHSFDPTPGSITYMEENAEKGVSFHPWGLWNENAEMKFYFPLNEDHTSFFLKNMHKSDKYFTGHCYTLKHIMEKLDHKQIYLLKIDIEGSWYEVIKDFVADKIFPKFLGVEFDSPAPVWRVAEICKLLARNGYAVVVVEKDNVTFERRADVKTA